MKIDIALSGEAPGFDLREGNVYPVRGGRGSSLGHMMVVVALTDPKNDRDGHMAVYLTIDRDGDIIGGGAYAQHYLRDKAPIAFVDGIDEVVLTMRSL